MLNCCVFSKQDHVLPGICDSLQVFYRLEEKQMALLQIDNKSMIPGTEWSPPGTEFQSFQS